MIRQFGISSLVLAALAVGLLALPASAGQFGYGAYVWSSPYPADLSPLYAVGTIPTPPYFALHPPVYYETPIPRTYGYSPWAYPPYITTPEIVEPVPEIIQNKFVPQPSKKSTEKQKMVSAPLKIQNPYVVSAKAQVKDSLAAK